MMKHMKRILVVLVMTLLCTFPFFFVLSAHGECQHNYVTKVRLREPSCTEQGNMIQECTSCHQQREMDIPALGHDFSLEYIIDKPATCGEQGQKSRHCTRCSERTDLVSIKALNHEFVHSIVQPTCTEYGYNLRKCSNCGLEAKDQFVDPLGHDSFYTAVEATCTEKGYRLWKCNRCGLTGMDQFVDESGHRPSEWIIPTDADCTRESFTRKIICLDCGALLESQKIEKQPHSLSLIEKIYPTCETEGRQAGVYCELCCRYIAGGEIIAKMPHKIVVVEKGFPATCYTDGRTDCTACVTCNTMNKLSEPIPALNHEGGRINVTKREKTCLEDGYKMDATICKFCGFVFSPENTSTDQVIDRAPGNHELMYVQERAATTSHIGWIEHWECTQMERETEYFIQPLKRVLIDDKIEWIPITIYDEEAKAYPVNDGFRVFCQVDKSDVVIEILPHSHYWIVDEKTSVKETCLTEGRTVSVCTLCNTEMTSIVPATGHIPGTWEKVEYTSNDEGNGIEYVTHCTVCGKEIRRQDIPQELTTETSTQPSSQQAEAGKAQNIFKRIIQMILNFFARLFGR